MDIKKEIESVLNENEFLKKQLQAQIERTQDLRKQNGTLEQFFNSTVIVKVFHSKKRRNTTVKFLDGSSVTVKLKKGEKHCIETAIAYALLKRLYPPFVLKAVAKNVEETDK